MHHGVREIERKVEVSQVKALLQALQEQREVAEMLGITRAMAAVGNRLSWDVPLVVDTGHGPDWDTAH